MSEAEVQTHPASAQKGEPVGETWDLFNQGDFVGAVRAAGRAFNEHQLGRHLHFAGLSLLRLGNVERGVSLLWMAADLHSDDPSFCVNACYVLGLEKQFDGCIAFAARGEKSFPDDARFSFIRGKASEDKGDLVAAQAAYRRTLRIDPDYPHTKLHLANVLAQIPGQEEEAVRLYREVMQGRPGEEAEAALLNLVYQLRIMRRDAEATAMIPLLGASRHPQASFVLSTLLLERGDYLRGFAAYRGRFALAAMQAELPRMSRLPWAEHLRDVAGKRVLVVCEQGFGDNVQFVRFVPKLLGVARSVTIETMGELFELFQTVHPDVEVIVRGDPVGGYDVLVPMLDLPALLGVTLDTLPAELPYLSSSPHLVELLRLPDNGRLRVGVVWSGGEKSFSEDREMNRRRSMSLANFTPIIRYADTHGADLVVLQPLSDPGCLSHLQEDGVAIQAQIQLGEAFSETAAYIEQLDLVIAVDTAVAHLAGAMGKPVWMLSRRDACWRWGLDQETSPWYPSNMRIFHQRKGGDWGGVIKEVLSALAKILTH